MIKYLWPGAYYLDHKRRVWVVLDQRIWACRIGPWVILGESFIKRLTPLEVLAAVAHELGHGWLQQLGRLVVKSLAPAFLPDLIRQQELKADDYAKQQGLGKELASALLKFKHAPQTNYPTVEERVRRLTC